MTKIGKIARGCAVALSIVIAAAMLLWMLPALGGDGAAGYKSISAAIMDKLDIFINNANAAALEGIVPIEKVYRLDENALVAPEPDQELFGSSTEPRDVEPVIEAASKLLQGQSLVWNSGTELAPGSKVEWYLDETILVITWKEVINSAVWTFSEVKVAHPSQLRRHIADNTFGAPVQYTPSDMATAVNAVVAINGDFYKFRDLGVVVYKRAVYRWMGQFVDSCCFDTNGDMKFIHKREVMDEESAKQFVADNDILFSVAFGPVLIEDGVNVAPPDYIVGEINDIYARAAISQMDSLHYLLTTVNTEGNFGNAATVAQLAAELESRGCRQSYTLDGGQTATIVMNDRVINSVQFGSQRNISDIIYFATALPER